MIRVLSGVRVLDLSRILTGPFCSMILADLGAEVIKVENPEGGDDTRSWGPPFLGGESAYFLCVNRNKKSMTLNLTNEKGRQILYKVAEKCDIVVENFSPGVAERIGVDYGAIRKVNPRVIYCSISGFGQDGVYSDHPAYDIVIQGMSGLMSVTGEPDRPPVRIGVAISDIGAGMYAAMAILSGLILREKTGRGQYIDISLLDSTVSWMTYMAANYFASGEIPKPMGSEHPNIVPYQCFKAGDGKYLTLAVGNDRIWIKFCSALARDDLSGNPHYATNPQRVKNRKELIPLLAEVFLKKSRDEWVDILLKQGIPCGPVYTIDEVFADPQILHRKMLLEISHPKAGNIRQIGNPLKFSDVTEESDAPPSLLSQHTAEILRNLVGCSDQTIKQLRKESII